MGSRLTQFFPSLFRTEPSQNFIVDIKAPSPMEMQIKEKSFGARTKSQSSPSLAELTAGRCVLAPLLLLHFSKQLFFFLPLLGWFFGDCSVQVQCDLGVESGVSRDCAAASLELPWSSRSQKGSNLQQINF